MGLQKQPPQQPPSTNRLLQALFSENNHPRSKLLPATIRERVLKEFPQAYSLAENGSAYVALFPCSLEEFEKYKHNHLSEPELITNLLDQQRTFQRSSGLHLQDMYTTPSQRNNHVAFNTLLHAINQHDPTRNKPIYTKTNTQAGFNIVEKLAQETNRVIYNGTTTHRGILTNF